MKNLFKSGLLCFALITAFAVFTLRTEAQSNTVPDLMPPVANEIATFFTTPSTNWYAASYVIYNTDSAQLGYGVAAFYKVTEFVGAFLRVDSLGKSLTMPSGNFQLQLPVTVMGKITAIPFAFTGVAFPLGRSKDPSVAGILGAGFAFRLPQTTAWYVPKDVLIDVEKWTNVQGQEIRGGLAWKF